MISPGYGVGVLADHEVVTGGETGDRWGYLRRTADLWNWLLTGSPPIASPTQIPNGDTMRNWIAHYSTVLADTCSFTDQEIADVLTESLIPPDGTITADMLDALLRLQAEGTAPEGLTRHVSSLAPISAQPLDGGLFKFDCTQCDRSVQCVRTAPGFFTVSCSSCHAGNLVRVS
ncbi:hypothetical protein J1792_32445 [Streptomyces triculaminicus]|uniref:Uncharacterized protein n=1 Tax=Streptomyces triculaminicus TaxID=2816232 RepID=A0A939JU95_9ACTN|nr:hypothetical protein [Streptomyces triculaminicus]MBO0657255.1 hypothetical protein [Streptomyces triculaminicus]